MEIGRSRIEGFLFFTGIHQIMGYVAYIYEPLKIAKSENKIKHCLNFTF